MNKVVIALVSAYCAVSMVSNVCSCRILDVFGWGIDGGTFMFPLIFVIRDLIHKHSDFKTSKVAIFTCAACNVFMFASFAVVALLPPDMSTGAQSEFATVLLPSGRIILGSILSLALVELIDAAVYEKVSLKRGKGIASAFASNLVSIPLDSAVIALVGFYGVVPDDVVVSIFVTNVAIKFAMTTLFLPLAKKRENIRNH